MVLQQQLADPESTLNFYRKAAKLRRGAAFTNNRIDFHKTDENVFSFVRSADNIHYLVILNLGNVETDADFTRTDFNKGDVVLSNVRGIQNQQVDLKSVHLSPGDFYVVKIHQQNDKEEL